MRLSLAALMLILGSVAAHADSDTLSDSVYLRKLSLHLRGIKPLATDYQDLARAGDRAEFLNRKIAEYLNSVEAQDRMVYRLSERFQILPPDQSLSVSWTSFYPPNPTDLAKGLREDAMTQIFRRLVAENRPWDDMLTTKQYMAYPSYSDINLLNDFEFFRPLAPNLPLNNSPAEFGTKPVPLSFRTDDASVGGVITTARFLARYSTTNLNKNRRRAAAVFRIFMCDPMFPIIPPPPDKKGAELNQAFEDDVHGSSILGHGVTVSDAARHGANRDCASCHNKLDPMGLTFQNMGFSVNPQPSPGYLTFTHADGQVLKNYLRGIGDLGQAITKQPEYVSCQINWLWQQFIGRDIPLSPDRLSQLAQSFDAVGRRTNDFVNILVRSPEFRHRPLNTAANSAPGAAPSAAASVGYAQVAPLLKRCDTCHDDSPSYTGGSIGSPNNSRFALIEILRRFTLPDSDRDRMPKDWKKWDPADLDKLKAWLRGGAVDDQGRPHLKPNDVKGIQ